MTSEKLSQAIAQIKAGNKQAALPLLKEVIQKDPTNEIAWLWLYSCVEDPSQKKYCLEKALEINPNNQNARTALEKLSSPQHVEESKVIRESPRPQSIIQPSVRPVQKQGSRSIYLPFVPFFVLIAIFAVIFVVYSLNKSRMAASARPSCVTLSMYNSVIDQVMHVQPTWGFVGNTNNRSYYKWSVQDSSGYHSLSTTLTSDSCVCATVASSQFDIRSDGSKDMVGLLQGAAIAPISELDYMSSWLAPKLMLSCGVAVVTQGMYEAETTMADGTTWELSCLRDDNIGTYGSLYNLSIAAPDCIDVLK